MEFRYDDGVETQVVRVIEQGDGFEIRIGERRYHVKAREVDDSTLDFWVDGRFHRARHAAKEEQRWVKVEDEVYQLHHVRYRRRRRHGGEGEGTLGATMPGQVTAVLVAQGEQVERGQLLALMEAMKMELRVVAPYDGVVAEVFVSEGQAVERGQTLVELQNPAS